MSVAVINIKKGGKGTEAGLAKKLFCQGKKLGFLKQKPFINTLKAGSNQSDK